MLVFIRNIDGGYIRIYYKWHFYQLLILRFANQDNSYLEDNQFIYYRMKKLVIIRIIKVVNEVYYYMIV
jgi:hypothetical protein